MQAVTTANASPWLFSLLLFLGALSITAAMAWNDFAKHMIDNLTYSEKSTKGKAIYAVMITTVMVLISVISATMYPEIIDLGVK